MTPRLYIKWALSAFIAIVFVQSLFFKFTGSVESVYIFSTLRAWSGIALFEPAGRWIIGTCELAASISSSCRACAASARRWRSAS